MPHCVVCGNPFKVNQSATAGSSWRGPEAANLVLPCSGFLVKDLLITVFQQIDPELANRLRTGENPDYMVTGQHGNCKISSPSALCRQVVLFFESK